MMHKQGISPLIAIVLLVGFVIALASLILIWSNSTYSEVEGSVSKKSSHELACAQLVDMDIESACIFGSLDLDELDDIQVVMENRKYHDIDGFIFKLVGDSGSVLINDDRELKAYEIKTYNIDVGGSVEQIGMPRTFKVIPNVTIEGKEYSCAYMGEETTSPVNICALIEDFDDGDAGYFGTASYSTPASFAVEDENHGVCDVGSENCEFSLDNAGDVAQAFADTRYDNVTIEADVIFKSEYGGQSDAGVMARYTDAYHWYQVRLDKGNGNIIYFGKKRPDGEGGHTNIGPQVSLPFTIQYDISYRLKFVLLGERLIGYVNGVQYLDYTDNNNPYNYGDVGLKTWNMHAHFDNVEVHAYGGQ